MPLTNYLPGDICYCRALVCNLEGTPLSGYPVFVILDVYGSYFFAPGFTENYDNYMGQYPELPEGATVIEVLPDFLWPEGAGNAEGIRWYGAVTDPGVTSIVGEMGTFTFGWSE